MKRRLKFTTTILTAIFLVSCTQTQEITIKDAWARPGIAGGNSAVYFIIDNPTGQDLSLISASTEVSTHVELHMSSHDGHGTAMMRPVELVEIPAHNIVEFIPGGLHVMLIGLVNDLKRGDHFMVSLQFDDIGEIDIDVVVMDG
jgi:periplasmic copper chaperone A